MRTTRSLVIAAAIAALVASGCEWHFETRDGRPGPNGRILADVGEYSAPVPYNGRPPRLLLRRRQRTHLRHAYFG